MTRKEAIVILNHNVSACLNGTELGEALDMAIQALAQQSCEDTISRQAAIDAFETFIHELGIKDEPYNYGELVLSVKNVPPVKPQEKTGHWIVKKDCEGKTRECICDQCGYETGKYTWKNPNYCAECGAKMVKPQERENKNADSN